VRARTPRFVFASSVQAVGPASVWCGAGDLARLLVAAVLSDVPFALVHAVSPPATERFDTSNPFGWTPSERPAAA